MRVWVRHGQAKEESRPERGATWGLGMFRTGALGQNSASWVAFRGQALENEPQKVFARGGMEFTRKHAKDTKARRGVRMEGSTYGVRSQARNSAGSNRPCAQIDDSGNLVLQGLLYVNGAVYRDVSNWPFQSGGRPLYEW